MSKLLSYVLSNIKVISQYILYEHVVTTIIGGRLECVQETRWKGDKAK